MARSSMNRDYRAKITSRAQRPARVGGGTILGIFIGLVLGLAVGAGVFYYISRTPSPFQTDGGATKTAPAPSGGPSPSAVGTSEKPRFDFYKILPGAEEPKSAGERKTSDTKPGNVKPAEAPKGIEQKAARPPEARPAEARAGDQYFLQVGSFANAADAENEKAKLALLGFEANIQTATLADKGQRHRVRLGPYPSPDEMNRNKAELAKRGFEATVIKNP